MIAPGTTFEGPLRVSLERIVFTQLERRNPRRVQFYFKLLTRFPTHDPGLVMLIPLPGAGGGQQHGYYTLLDGHHRTIAALLAGRRDVLALIQYAPSPEPPEEERAPEPEPDAAPQEPQEGDQGVCTLSELFEHLKDPHHHDLTAHTTTQRAQAQ